MSTIYTYENIRDRVGKKSKWLKKTRKAAGKTLDRKGKTDPNSVLIPHLCGQHLLGLGNGAAGVETLGAGSCAVKNGVAAVDAHAVVKSGLALGGALVTRVGQPTVGLEENGRTKVLLAVPPV
jgi:hypothetical protein